MMLDHPTIAFPIQARDNPSWRLTLLGAFRLEHHGVTINLPRRKVEALLAYLVLHPERRTRDDLATLFWGDSLDDKARHSLRTALATLRQHIGEDLLIADREHVQINPNFPLGVDLHELLALEKRLDDPELTNPLRLRALLDLWSGEMLASFYEDWVVVEREHYHTRLLTTLLNLTQALRARSEYAQAIAVAQKMLSFDAANEHAHQHLMFCYMAAGDRAAALRQYELCAAALARELDAPPMPETTALYQWIKRNNAEEPAAAARITNLPIPLTSFVGRTRESAEVKRLLVRSPYQKEQATHAVRLLSLVGAGGNGKTRLAIQVATDLIDRFADGVWWVELAALTRCDQVANAVAKALGVSAVRNETITQSLINFVGDKELLLVLDNCEHLIEPVAQLAATLLSHCPDLQILTTSREPLNIPGEMLWHMPTLSLPDPQHLSLVDLVLQYECIRLFVERATAVQPSFRLTPENTLAVATICARLDGIPLAIELAAARVKVLPVEQIAIHLTSAIGARFALLTQGSRTALPRQQTLRAAIDWSYDLLNPAERLLFCQLAVFRGGFTLAAIEQVAEVGGESLTGVQHPATTLDLLTQLVDKSLVIVEPQGGQNRYRLLETLREYALEQFTTPTALQAVQDRHAAFFREQAEQIAPELLGPRQQAGLAHLEVEHANLRAALGHLLTVDAGEGALRLATALYRFWEGRGYESEGRTWLQRALAQRAAAPHPIQAQALNAAGWLALRQSDHAAARPLFEEALILFEQEEEEVGIADTLQNLAFVAMNQGDYVTAQRHTETSLTLVRELRYEQGIARGLKLLGGLAWDQDRIAEARTYRQESLRLYQQLGNPVSIANAFVDVADCERFLDELVAAAANYEASLAISRSVGHKGLTAAALKGLGMVAFKQQDYTQARRYNEDALQIFRELGDKSHIGFALSNLGDVARKVGDNSQALAYYGQTLQIMYEVGYKWPIFYALEDIAELLAESGQQIEGAARLWGAAGKLRQETGIAVPPNQQEMHNRVLQHFRQQLAEATFQRLYAAGHDAHLAQIAAEAAALALTPASNLSTLETK